MCCRSQGRTYGRGSASCCVLLARQLQLWHLGPLPDLPVQGDLRLLVVTEVESLQRCLQRLMREQTRLEDSEQVTAKSRRRGGTPLPVGGRVLPARHHSPRLPTSFNVRRSWRYRPPYPKDRLWDECRSTCQGSSRTGNSP